MKHDQAPNAVRLAAADFLLEVRAHRGEYGPMARREQYHFAAEMAENTSWAHNQDCQKLAHVQWLLNFRNRTRPGVARFVAMNKGWRIEPL